MSQRLHSEYDIVVVGAGIGGLVAAAFAAKAGAKVLVVDQASKVGGYCGSFSKAGYIFDEAVHYINHMRPGGLLRSILDELAIGESLGIVSADPSDVLVMPDQRVSIYRDLTRTAEELSDKFPDDASAISRFFSLVSSEKFSNLVASYSKCSFENMLNGFFRTAQLRTALGVFGTTMGLPPGKLSAVAALGYFRGSILDGGYHCIGGAQRLSDLLAERVKSCGGQIHLGQPVTKILASSRAVHGIEIGDSTVIRSRVVICGCDVTQVVRRLIDSHLLSADLTGAVDSLQPSISNLIVYLGITRTLKGSVPDCCNLWYFPYQDHDSNSLDITEDSRDDGFVHIGLTSLHDKSMAPVGGEALTLFAGASYRTKGYWDENKERLAEILVRRAEHVLPRLTSVTRVRVAASPYTLYRYTLNRDGAYRGWEPSPIQSQWGLVPIAADQPEGLVFAGHWVTTPAGNGGVSMVAQMGKMAARSALRIIRHVPIN